MARNNTTTRRARQLRSSLTDAEKKLWQHLRRDQLHGLHFRRQHPVPPYIIDFVCSEKNLAIELDGGQHTENQEYDAERTRFLEEQGYRVLRFWNNDVLSNIEGVLEVVARTADVYPLPDPPPQAGEGDQRGAPPQAGFGILKKEGITDPLFLLPRPEDADPALAEGIAALGFTVITQALLTAQYFPVPPQALAEATHLIITSRRGLKTLPLTSLPLLSIGTPPGWNILASAVTAEELQAHLDTLPVDAKPLYLRGSTIRRPLHHPGLREAIVYDLQENIRFTIPPHTFWGIGFLSPRLTEVFLKLMLLPPASICFCLSPVIADILKPMGGRIVVAKTPSAAGFLAAIKETL
jgi:very-short-patch-repair endonuclease/uroporphyrinogen-III synthase